MNLNINLFNLNTKIPNFLVIFILLNFVKLQQNLLKDVASQFYYFLVYLKLAMVAVKSSDVYSLMSCD